MQRGEGVRLTGGSLKKLSYKGVLLQYYTCAPLGGVSARVGRAGRLQNRRKNLKLTLAQLELAKALLIGYYSPVRRRLPWLDRR